MPALTICDGVMEVGSAHDDRQLFDCLMPTTFGTTYNSYVVAGTRATAILDTVDPDKTSTLLRNLADAKVDRVDYIVCLHTEQDHSGSVRAVLEKWPDAQLVGSKKVAEFMSTHHHIPESRFLLIGEGDVLDLGGKTLRFTLTPFAHWPDNTMAFLEEDRILFSNDLFGSHYSSEKIFATAGRDQLQAARDYYAEIFMPFAPHVRKYVAKARSFDPVMIAPSHGPVWWKPEAVLSLYDEWLSDVVKPVVVIPFVTMHGSTGVLVERLASRLAENGVSAICRDIASEPPNLMLESGHMVSDLVDAAALVIAAPAVLGGAHPAAAFAAILATAMKPKVRYFGLIGSFGWGSRIAENMETYTAGLKAERLAPFLVKGLPTEEELGRLDVYAVELAEKVKAAAKSGT
jgi:flavorubredoxin